MSTKKKNEVNEAEVTTSATEECVEETKTSEEQAPPEKTPLELAEESISVLTDKLMRTAAEFDNYKKRSIREKDELYATAVCNTVATLLPVLDNLERAITTSVQAEESAGILEGVEMIVKQFHETLSTMGVLPIEAVGNPFDPEKHNAVMTEESDKDENTVLEEFLKGYVYKDKVVRHSVVKVSN